MKEHTPSVDRHLWLLALFCALAGAVAVAPYASHPVVSVLCALASALVALLLAGGPHAGAQSGTRLALMDLQRLQQRLQQVQQALREQAPLHDLQRSVLEMAAELVSCVDERDARLRFAAALRSWWQCRSVDLFLWERGTWRSLGGEAEGAEPTLQAAIQLPLGEQPHLILDLSPGVDGQAAVVLRFAQAQPALAGCTASVQRMLAESLRSVLALSLRRVLLYQRLETLGRSDPLTGLFRRWYGERRLRELVDQDHVVSIAMLDIDHFKRVNDQFGHPMGDQVLKALGHCLRHTLRSADLCARVGGEEFLLILPGTSGDTAVMVVERLRQQVAALEGLPCTVTLSAGVASCHIDESAEELVARADRALYQAKSGGRNRVVQAVEDRGGSGSIRTRTKRHSVDGLPGAPSNPEEAL